MKKKLIAFFLLCFGVVSMAIIMNNGNGQILFLSPLGAEYEESSPNQNQGRSWNHDNNNTMGIEYNSTADVYHIWNEMDNYYINATSGIQLTNHFQEYWSQNKWCAYVKLGQWKKICIDEFDWTWYENTDNLTYVNLTGTASENYAGGYKIDLTVEYYLESNAIMIRITPTLKNDGKAFEGNLIWRIENIQINMTEENDRLAFDDYEYWLNESINVSYDNLTYKHFYVWDNREYLRLDWIAENYTLRIQNESGQYNAPIELWLEEVYIPKDTSYSTTFYWIDKPTSFDFEINVYEFSAGAPYMGNIVCDGGVNSAGFDQNTILYDLSGGQCNLTMMVNYTVEILLTPNNDWNLDYDAQNDHINDGVTSWIADYTNALGIDESGGIAFSDSSVNPQFVVTTENIGKEPAGETYSDEDILLGGDTGVHEYGEVVTGRLYCDPDGDEVASCIEFSDANPGELDYDLESVDVTDGEQNGGEPLNITFIAYPDDDWTDGDIQYLEYFIEAEGGDPETGFMRWNWTIKEGDAEPPADTCTPITNWVIEHNCSLVDKANSIDNLTITEGASLNLTGNTNLTTKCVNLTGKGGSALYPLNVSTTSRFNVTGCDFW